MTARRPRDRAALCRRKWRNTVLNAAIAAQFSDAPRLRDLRAAAKIQLVDAGPKENDE